MVYSTFCPTAPIPAGGMILSEQQVHVLKFQGTRSKIQKIPITTLDDFIFPGDEKETAIEKEVVAVLKIDVERHEAAVVKGARRLLKSGKVQNVFT
jgi:hypothetical protein